MYLDSALVSSERARDENDKGPGLSLGVAKSCGNVAVEITDMESPSPDPSPHKSRLIAGGKTLIITLHYIPIQSFCSLQKCSLLKLLFKSCLRDRSTYHHHQCIALRLQRALMDECNDVDDDDDDVDISNICLIC